MVLVLSLLAMINLVLLAKAISPKKRGYLITSFVINLLSIVLGFISVALAGNEISDRFSSLFILIISILLIVQEGGMLLVSFLLLVVVLATGHWHDLVDSFYGRAAVGNPYFDDGKSSSWRRKRKVEQASVYGDPVEENSPYGDDASPYGDDLNPAPIVFTDIEQPTQNGKSPAFYTLWGSVGIVIVYIAAAMIEMMN